MTTSKSDAEIPALQALSADIDAEVRHRFAVIDGLRMHWAEAGSGEPVILLHGWPQHWWEWRHLIGPLSRHYRVICPDLRGLGWSEGDGTGHDFDRMALDLRDLLDHLGLGQVRIVGRDWGLVVGYRTVLDRPERVHRFVAIAGVHPWTGQRPSLPVFLRPWHIYLLAAAGGSAALQERMVRRSLRAWRHRGAFDEREAEIYAERMRRPAARAATVAFNRAVLVREVPHFLRHSRTMRTTVPILHLNGGDDPLSDGVPTCFGDHAANMRLERIPDCGHFVSEEQPRWLVERVSAFFR
ncbi:alpha/beta fold hydrolase [Nocardia sp. NPDC057227]|uniref:alpha/beta fold hydrolase n=1 Tax=Nocardia sp. NPDC057227 TaxID=3346056 RepID=UPI00363A888A